MNETLPAPKDATQTTSGFVELDRRFTKVAETEPKEDLAYDSYALQFGHHFGGQSWADLLKLRLVVVLGEPGSGKTAELRRQHQRQLGEGKPSFLIRLDELAAQGWDAALTREEKERFAQWFRGKDSATFFLDSVDESKLQREADFHLALKRCADALGQSGLRRAHFIISSRISEWHPETDGAEVRALLALPPAPAVGQADGKIEPGATPAGNDLQLVQIQPLDRDRVGRFARARGVAAVEDFLVAVDRTHAWEFARRPLDVIDLASFWARNQRLGSLTEMLEFSITQNLRENPGRQKSDVLTPAQARAGAETLAAAAIFCRRLTFRVPDGALVSDGLDPRACLPADWTEEQVQAMPARPLFDGASYGRMRFHHRRTMEYLAADWMRKRMAANCGLDELERLFFAIGGTQRVLRRSLAPVAAWLCAGSEEWNERFRGWVLAADPSIHLRYGDPAALPTAYKRRLLAALVERAQQRQWLWLDSNPAASSRLAEPALVPDILAMIGNRSLAADLRSEMLMIVRHARMASGADVALRVIASPDESESLKVYATAALRDLDDAGLRVRLADAIKGLPTFSESLAEVLLEALFPETIEPGLLALILGRTERSGRRMVGIKHTVGHLLETRMEPVHAPRVLGDLVRFVQISPYFNQGEFTPVSQRYRWLRKSLGPTVLMVLRRSSLTPAEAEDAVTALFLLETRDADSPRREEENKEMQQASLAHSLVRQRYFWRRFAWDESQVDKPQLARNYRAFVLFGRCLQPAAADFDWLVSDLGTSRPERERLVVLAEAVRAWDASGRSWAGLRRLRAAVGSNPELRRHLSHFLWRARAQPFQMRWYRLEHQWLMFVSGCRRLWNSCRTPYQWLRNRFYLWRDRRELAQGRRPGWVAEMVRESGGRTDHWAADDWKETERLHGRRTAQAARLGSKRGWRLYTPPLPHEKPDRNRTTHGTIAGLTGLLVAWHDGELDFSGMSQADAELAARYSLNELNDFPPWLVELAARRPEAVDAVFSVCLRHEWQEAINENGEPDLLRKLSWWEAPVPAVIIKQVMQLLESGEPASLGALTRALVIIVRQPNPPRVQLAVMARDRLTGTEHPTRAVMLWLAIWLQVDAAACLPVLVEKLGGPDAGQLMEGICSILNARNLSGMPLLPHPDYLTPTTMVGLVPLVFQHVSPAQDFDRTDGGVYSPGARDHAQEFRDSLTRMLVGSKSSGAAEALRQLADHPALALRRDWIQHLLDEHLEIGAELAPWKETDVRVFMTTNEAAPATNADLFRIVRQRLAGFKHLVEGGDLTPRNEVRAGDQERALRQMIARHLNRVSGGLYTAVEEIEIDRLERPDLRVDCAPLGSVPIEVKWAETPLHVLLERLKAQLVGQYLRDEKNQFGVFFVGRIGTQEKWDDGGSWLGFDEVIARLTARAAELVAAHPRAIGVLVVAVDFRPPERAAKEK